METLLPTARLKMKGDVYILPNRDGSVYFRNNEGSFRMQGKGILQWIEKLVPMFDGEHTLVRLTDGLPEPYQQRVYEIAHTLYDNGFLRDVSQDLPHALSDQILTEYSMQIEFIDHHVGSGAARFDIYRNRCVLIAGDGELPYAVLRALQSSGHANHMLAGPTGEGTEGIRDEQILSGQSQVDLATLSDAEFEANVEAFDAVFYASESGDVELLSRLESVCLKTGKFLLPLMVVDQVGLVGPMPKSLTGQPWGTLYKRIHQPVFNVDPHAHQLSSVARGLLANVGVFAFFKAVTGVAKESETSKFYRLNLETLSGKWRNFIPCTELSTPDEIPLRDVLGHIESEITTSDADALSFFAELTDGEVGIFHAWDEGELEQLPLCACRVQVALPAKSGPAILQSEVVCRALHHEEARIEAGQSGLEQYVQQRLASVLLGDVCVVAGRSWRECLERGLEKCLEFELCNRIQTNSPLCRVVDSLVVDDPTADYYWQAVRLLSPTARVAMDRELFGFPVVWISLDGQFFAGTGVNVTAAIRKALLSAIARTPNGIANLEFTEDEGSMSELRIPNAGSHASQSGLLELIQKLEEYGCKLVVYDVAKESFLHSGTIRVLGVSLRTEGAE